MPKSLRDQLKGVTLDSPTDEPTPEETPAEDVVVDDDKGKNERTADNVRGELLRKMSKQDQLLHSLSDQVTQLNSALRAVPAQTAQPQPANKTSLDDYTIDELSTARAEVPAEKLAEFDLYVNKRVTKDTIQREMSTFRTSHDFDVKQQTYAQQAADRFPDIKDETSDFARAVQKKLNDVPDAVLTSDPKLILHLANEVALDSDIKPTRRRTVKGLEKPASSNTGPGPGSKEKDVTLDKDLMKKLERALPAGKKFNEERLGERIQYYNEHIGDHVKKG